MEEYLPLIIQLISGALGGNIAGKLLKNMSLGTLGNSITGILGGGLGGYLLGMLGLGDGVLVWPMRLAAWIFHLSLEVLPAAVLAAAFSWQL